MAKGSTKRVSNSSDENTYEVESILQHRKKGGHMEFKVKWRGYGLNDCTWQVEKDLEGSSELLQAYKSKHPASFPSATPKAIPKTRSSASRRDQGEKKKVREEEEDNDSGDDETEKTSEYDATETDETNGDSDEKSDDVEDEEEQYEVESIVSHRVVRGKTWYLVAWKGCPGDDSEVLEEDLSGASELLEEYKKSHKNNPSERETAAPSTPLSSRRGKKSDSPIGSRASRKSRRHSPPFSAPSNKQSRRRSRTPSPSSSPSPGPSNRRSRRRSNTPSPSPGRSAKRARIDERCTSTPDSFLLLQSSTRRRPVADKKEASYEKSNEQSPPQSPTRVLPRRSCTVVQGEEEAAQEKKYGIAAGLRIEAITALNNVDKGKFVVKVTYRDPIPTGFKKQETLPTKLVRDSLDYQMLFDYYESILKT